MSDKKEYEQIKGIPGKELLKYAGILSVDNEAEEDNCDVTLSIPEDLLETLDKFARDWNTSRSGAIAQMILRTEKANLEAEMALGYKEMAELNKNEAQYYFQSQIKKNK